MAKRTTNKIKATLRSDKFIIKLSWKKDFNTERVVSKLLDRKGSQVTKIITNVKMVFKILINANLSLLKLLNILIFNKILLTTK